MKILILFLLPLFTMAQETTTDKFTTDSVLIITGSKDSLFNKSNLWLLDISSAGTTPYQSADKETGSIVCPVKFQFYSDAYSIKKKEAIKGGQRPQIGSAKVKIFAKDGKVKIIVSDLIWNGDGGTEDPIASIDNWSKSNLDNKDMWQKERAYEYVSIVEKMKDYSKLLIRKYAEYLNKKSETDF